jgi:hypothetical protein
MILTRTSLPLSLLHSILLIHPKPSRPYPLTPLHIALARQRIGLPNPTNPAHLAIGTKILPRLNILLMPVFGHFRLFFDFGFLGD